MLMRQLLRKRKAAKLNSRGAITDKQPRLLNLIKITYKSFAKNFACLIIGETIRPLIVFARELVMISSVFIGRNKSDKISNCC